MPRFYPYCNPEPWYMQKIDDVLEFMYDATSKVAHSLNRVFIRTIRWAGINEGTFLNKLVNEYMKYLAMSPFILVAYVILWTYYNIFLFVVEFSIEGICYIRLQMGDYDPDHFKRRFPDCY